MSALLDSAIAQIGKLHDGPDVVRLAQEIGQMFPDLAEYCKEAGPDTPWCGIFIAWLLAKLGIKPPAGFMYVDNYKTSNWGAARIEPGQEQPGDIICLQSPHHVTILKEVHGDRYICVGGNQTGPSGHPDSVTQSSYAQSGRMAIIRPPIGGQVAAANDDHPEIKLGDTGPAVIELQRLLGFPTPTGIFDSQTDVAVRGFQSSHGLDVDGEVGYPQTWPALLGNAPATPQPTNVQTSKGSWYSQYRGKYIWKDSGDAPNSAALVGCPDDAQGIARPEKFGTLGNWFMVGAPNGKVSIEQQTDHGPGARTGRTIDISAAAAERFGYSPANFPTDSIFTFWPVDPPHEVAGLSKQQQAVKYRDIRKGLPPMTDQPQPAPQPNPKPEPVPQPSLPTQLPTITKIDFSKFADFFEEHKDESVKGMTRLNALLHAIHPDVLVGTAASPVAPVPAATPIHKTTAFQLGAVGGVLTGILHQLGVIDPNMAILGAIVSAGTAFLGPSGAIVGTIVMNLVRAAAASSVK